MGIANLLPELQVSCVVWGLTWEQTAWGHVLSVLWSKALWVLCAYISPSRTWALEYYLPQKVSW